MKLPWSSFVAFNIGRRKTLNRGIQYYGFQEIYSSPVLEQTEEIEDWKNKIEIWKCDTLEENK